MFLFSFSFGSSAKTFLFFSFVYLLSLSLYIYIFFQITASKLSIYVTLICRIDTLERPSLLPRCVGYAALKLCVDADGLQPVENNNNDNNNSSNSNSRTTGGGGGTSSSSQRPPPSASSVHLNAGRFLIPLVQGRASVHSPLSETLMEQLPPIPGAYLAIRLFDPTAEKCLPPSSISTITRQSASSAISCMWSKSFITSLPDSLNHLENSECELISSSTPEL